ncbi:MAG: hypothetical protein MJ252_25025 [archaeon]|nr:hypothetical protein [archaeon]
MQFEKVSYFPGSTFSRHELVARLKAMGIQFSETGHKQYLANLYDEKVSNISNRVKIWQKILDDQKLNMEQIDFDAVKPQGQRKASNTSSNYGDLNQPGRKGKIGGTTNSMANQSYMGLRPNNMLDYQNDSHLNPNINANLSAEMNIDPIKDFLKKNNVQSLQASGQKKYMEDGDSANPFNNRDTLPNRNIRNPQSFSPGIQNTEQFIQQKPRNFVYAAGSGQSPSNDIPNRRKNSGNQRRLSNQGQTNRDLNNDFSSTGFNALPPNQNKNINPGFPQPTDYQQKKEERSKPEQKDTLLMNKIQPGGSIKPNIIQPQQSWFNKETMNSPQNPTPNNLPPRKPSYNQLGRSNTNYGHQDFPGNNDPNKSFSGFPVRSSTFPVRDQNEMNNPCNRTEIMDVRGHGMDEFPYPNQFNHQNNPQNVIGSTTLGVKRYTPASSKALSNQSQSNSQGKKKEFKDNVWTNILIGCSGACVLLVFFYYFYLRHKMDEDGIDENTLTYFIKDVFLPSLQRLGRGAFYTYGFITIPLIVIIIAFFVIYKRKKLNKISSEIFEEIKTRLSQGILGTPQGTNNGMSENQIISEFSERYNMSEEQFKADILPRLRMMRQKDSMLREYQTLENDEPVTYWAWLNGN